MRLVRISLATKYRLLFGLAVVLIIGAALYVPWYRMESLVREQPYRVAQFAADEYFRRAMSIPGHAGALSAGPHADGLGLPVSVARLNPRFIPAGNPPSQGFAARAVRNFADHPDRTIIAETREREDESEHRYAFAVRATKSCLSCHSGKAPNYSENELAGAILVDVPAAATRQGLLWNRLIIIAAGLLGGVLSILVFYLITHRFMLSPIEELRSVAGRVAEGNLDVRSTLRTGDEFEHLAESINTMLERLRASQNELLRANRLLDQKLGEIAETNVTLYESNRIKSEFLANVSHELRTPLTSIIGFAELLREGPALDEHPKAARYAENILISGRILLEIINDLLDLAKIEAGKVELHIEDVNLGSLCETMVEFMRPQADQKQIDLAFDCPTPLPDMRSDRGRLRQILFNLLSNAIKFTPEGGRVRVAAQAIAENRLRVSVSDTGPGIPPEQQSAIFEKFRQIDQSATREHQGTGLGLAIAKELTTLLGGTIGVSSTPGAGATFTVEFPTSEPEPRDRPLVALV